MNTDSNCFRSPSAQRIWERDYRDKTDFVCEVFEFEGAEARGEGSLAAEIAKSGKRVCDLVVIRSTPDAVLIDFVKELPAVDFHPVDRILRSKFIGRDLGESLRLHMVSRDGRLASLFLNPEWSRYIGSRAKYDQSTNTVTVSRGLECPTVDIHYLSAPRPLTNH